MAGCREGLFTAVRVSEAARVTLRVSIRGAMRVVVEMSVVIGMMRIFVKRRHLVVSHGRFVMCVDVGVGVGVGEIGRVGG